MPRFYKYDEVLEGAKAITDPCNKTRLEEGRLETAVEIIFEAMKIYTYPDERQWSHMCTRIAEDLGERLHGTWLCFAAEKEIYACYTFSIAGNHLVNIKLDDICVLAISVKAPEIKRYDNDDIDVNDN